MAATIQAITEDKARIGEFAHLSAVAGELDERNDGERQLKAQNHLAENDKRSDFAFPGDANHENRGNDGDEPRDQAAEPGLKADIEKTFHDDLSGEGAGQRGVLAGGEQRAGEKRAGQACAEDGTQKFVGVGDFRDVVQAAGVKRGGAQDQDGGVDEQCETESEGGVENSEAEGFAAVAQGGAKRSRLHDAGVQIQIVRHYGRAEDSDGDVQHLAIAEDFRARNDSLGGFAPQGLREKNFVGETCGDAWR